MTTTSRAVCGNRIGMKRIDYGFTFRDPTGKLGVQIHDTVGEAQSAAAFNMEKNSGSRSFPEDWNTAHYRGYRIVRAKRTIEEESPDDWAVWRHNG